MPGREEALERVRSARLPTRSRFEEIGGQLVSPFKPQRGQDGPASTLPTENPPELYSTFAATEGQGGDPFSREFDFSDEGSRELPRGYTPGDKSTVSERSKRFIDQYFGGVDSDVINPATGRLYGKELKVHDALHDYMNVGNTLRGEELVTIGEKIATAPLAAESIGLTGLTQQAPMPWGSTPAANASFMEGSLQDGARMSGRTLIQQRGAARGSSMFRDRNNPASFLSPPITDAEFSEVTQRAREFYDQVHAGWMKSGDRSEAKAWNDEDANRYASKDFIEGDLQSMQIEGGYRDPGGLPYGPKEQFMNPPLVPVVDANEYDASIRRQLQPIAKRLAGEALADYERLNTPEQTALRQQAREWDARAKVLRDEWRMGRALNTTPDPALAAYVKMRGEFDPANYRILLADGRHEEAAGAALGPRPQPMTPNPKTRQYLNFSGGPDGSLEGVDMPVDIARGLGESVEDDRNLWKGGITGGLDSVMDPQGSGRRVTFLNPPNLGSRQIHSRTGPLAERSYSANPNRAIDSPTTERILLNAAADAKDKPRLVRAIRSGFNATADVAGAVPLFDPQFRNAVERGDVKTAASQVGKEYAAGTVTAPVVGAGMGVLQRVAPRAAAVALPAVTAVSQVVSPVAVVSQLGGSSRQSARQRAAERQAAQNQLQRAEAARRRGSRWKIPGTNIGVPELGISESGGLFFRGGR